MPTTAALFFSRFKGQIGAFFDNAKMSSNSEAFLNAIPAIYRRIRSYTKANKVSAWHAHNRLTHPKIQIPYLNLKMQRFVDRQNLPQFKGCHILYMYRVVCIVPIRSDAWLAGMPSGFEIHLCSSRTNGKLKQFSLYARYNAISLALCRLHEVSEIRMNPDLLVTMGLPGFKQHMFAFSF